MAAEDDPPRGKELPALPGTQTFDVAAQVAGAADTQRRSHPSSFASSGESGAALGAAGSARAVFTAHGSLGGAFGRPLREGDQVIDQSHSQPSAAVAEVNPGTVSTLAQPGGTVEVSSGASVEVEQRARIVPSTEPAITTYQLGLISSKMRSYQSGLRESIDDLRSRMPNDAHSQPQHLALLEFLGRLADDMGALAGEIEQAIDGGRDGIPEPVFLGRAQVAARALAKRAQGWWEEKGTTVIDVPFNLGMYSGALITLATFGVEGPAVAAGAAAVIAASALKTKS